MDFISGPVGMASQEDWEQADRQFRTEAAASRARRPAPAGPTQKESKPMGTTITLTPEMRKRLGLSANASTADAVEAMKGLNRLLEARNASNRAKLAAADASGSVTEDAIYEAAWGSPDAAGSRDPLDGLTPEEAAIYGALFPTDAAGAAASTPADDAIYRELWPEG